MILFVRKVEIACVSHRNHHEVNQIELKVVRLIRIKCSQV